MPRAAGSPLTTGFTRLIARFYFRLDSESDLLAAPNTAFHATRALPRGAAAHLTGRCNAESADRGLKLN